MPIANQTFILVSTVNLMRRIYTDASLSTPDLELIFLYMLFILIPVLKIKDIVKLLKYQYLKILLKNKEENSF